MLSGSIQRKKARNKSDSLSIMVEEISKTHWKLSKNGKKKEMNHGRMIETNSTKNLKKKKKKANEFIDVFMIIII